MNQRNSSAIAPSTLAALAESIQAENAALESAVRGTLERAISLGSRLREARELVAHGEWQNWCTQVLPAVSLRSIQAYMRLHERRDELGFAAQDLTSNAQPVAHLGIRDALELLAESDDPTKVLSPANIEKAAGVLKALREIRDTRTYRATHKTFEAYLRETWGDEMFETFQFMDNVCPKD